MNQPRILILAATWPEIWKTSRRLDLERHDGYSRGHFAGCDVTAAVSGMGSERMTRCLSENVADDPCHWLLIAGFAGALNPDLKTAAVLLPRTLLHERTEAIQLDVGDEHRLLTVDHVVNTPQDKRALYERTRADAVDMESHVVVAEANRLQLPCTVIRAISDTADTSIPPEASNWMQADGLPKIREPMLWMFSRWSRFQTMRRMIKDTNHAAEALAKTIPGMIRQWASEHRR